MKKLVIRVVIFCVIAAGIGTLILVINRAALHRVEQTTAFRQGAVESLNEIPAEEELVLQDDKVSLYLSMRDNCAVLRVVDSVTGQEWSSYGIPEIDENTSSVVSGTLYNTMMNIYYNDSADFSGMNMAGNLGTKTTYSVSGNTVRLLFNFDDEEIQVTLDLSLKDGTLDAKIPFDGIRENGDYELVSIDLLPVFGMSHNSDGGYAVLPDGCGVMYPFKENEENTALKTWNVYSPDDTDIDQAQKNTDTGLYNASIPVFGIKDAGKAFLGIITQGEENSRITFAPAGYRINLYRVYSSFYYRKRYIYTTPDGQDIYYVGKNVVENDFTVNYCFLTGNDADYSGMAVGYRNYLLQNNLLKQAVGSNSDYAFSFDFLCSVTEKGILWDSMMNMTDFADIEKAVTDIRKAGMNNVHIMLYGWQRDGYGINPSHYKVSESAGGFSGLKRLTDFTGSLGYQVFLVDNYVEAAEGVNGFASRKYAIHDMEKLVLSDKGNVKFYVNPRNTLGFLKTAAGSLRNNGINGIAFEKIGTTIYSEQFYEKTISKEQTADVWRNMLSLSNQQFGNSAAEGANSYLYGGAYRLFNVPDSSSKYLSFGREIPFLQMVLHGSIYYTTEIGNLSYDINLTKLRWIEYGSMPDFILTNENASRLKYTNMNIIFSSEIDQWVSYAKELNEEFTVNLKGIQSAKMMKHQYLTDQVVKITYDNGCQIYINYGDSTEIEGRTIKSMDYIVVENGEIA